MKIGIYSFICGMIAYYYNLPPFWSILISIIIYEKYRDKLKWNVDFSNNRKLAMYIFAGDESTLAARSKKLVLTLLIVLGALGAFPFVLYYLTP